MSPQVSMTTEYLETDCTIQSISVYKYYKYAVCVDVILLCHPSADVWSEGDLPPGWREISDSSEVYFWHVPTGTTQYHRPVAAGNHQLHNSPPDNEPDTEPDPQQETQQALKPPAEVRKPCYQAAHEQIWVQLQPVRLYFRLSLSCLMLVKHVTTGNVQQLIPIIQFLGKFVFYQKDRVKAQTWLFYSRFIEVFITVEYPEPL